MRRGKLLLLPSAPFLLLSPTSTYTGMPPIQSRPCRRRYCTACAKHIFASHATWNFERDICKPCGTEKIAREERHRVTIIIPPRKKCQLCQEFYRLTHYAHKDQNGNNLPPFHRCVKRRKSEKCSMCSKIKKRRDFRKVQANHDVPQNEDDNPELLWKTCESCRKRAIERTLRKRNEAAQLGEHNHDCTLCKNSHTNSI